MEIHESKEKIRVRAHQLWEQAGRPHGHDVEHWLQAEREFLLNSTAAAPLMADVKQMSLADGQAEKSAKKSTTRGAPKPSKKTSGRSKAKQPL